MIEEARKIVETIKEAFDVLSAMELPTEEQKIGITRDAAMTLIAQLEQVTRERDAAVRCLKEELRNQSVISLCENCRYKSEGDYIPNDCMDCVNGCNWQWRSVEVER